MRAPASPSAALERLSLRELNELHSKILLAVVRAHGVPAAMHLVGASLQTLAATAQAGGSTSGGRVAFSAATLSTAALAAGAVGEGSEGFAAAERPQGSQLPPWRMACAVKVKHTGGRRREDAHMT